MVSAGVAVDELTSRAAWKPWSLSSLGRQPRPASPLMLTNSTLYNTFLQ